MKHVFTVLSSNYMLHGEPVQMTYASFENETDALEFYMALVEESEYKECMCYLYSSYPWFKQHLAETLGLNHVTDWDVFRRIYAYVKDCPHALRADLHVEKTVLL